jgi:hypothetical protein
LTFRWYFIYINYRKRYHLSEIIINFNNGIKMNLADNALKSPKIIFEGDFCEVSILKISKDKFNEYKANGLPSSSKKAVEWEKLTEKLDAESTGSMLYSESYGLNLESADSSLLDLKAKLGKSLNISTFPTVLAKEDNKNYLVQIRIAKNAQYYCIVNGELDPAKLSLSIKPEKLPGGEILNSLLMEYDGNFFSYSPAYDRLEVSQVFIVDPKGVVSHLSHKGNDLSDDLIVESIEKNLTDWFPAEINPQRVGEYEVELLEGAVWPMPACINAEWNGKAWENHLGKVIKIRQWRGLITPA